MSAVIPRAPAQVAPFAWPDRPLRVALVHYWLVGMRGGEKVLETFCELFPNADVYTLVCDPDKISETIRRHRITTSFLQKIGGKRHYQKLLPLMPFALESFDLTGYDLIISSEAGPAKGVVTRPDAVHICYCHSPMRYIWDAYPEYYRASGRATRGLMSSITPLLRQWDVTTANRVDHFIANSTFVANRIRKFYRRDAEVIYPPVELDRFAPAAEIDDAYLCAGQITPYKKVEIAVEAFTRMGKRLDVVGSGATDALRAAAGPSVRLIPAVSNEELARRFATARALIYPGVEDFGIIPLEVMASGRPVIAFGRGGALETVAAGQTGLFFEEQTAESLMAAVERFEATGVSGSPADFAEHVASFSKQAFVARIRAFITDRLGGREGEGRRSEPADRLIA